MTTQISGTSGVTFPAGGVGNPAGAVVGTTDSQTLSNKTISGNLNMTGGAKYQVSGVTTNALAWANFNGTSSTPITPRANYNISSVTKNGTGDYTLNFTNSVSDTNYCVVGSSRQLTSSGYLSIVTDVSTSGTQLSRTTSAFQIQCQNVVGGLNDNPYLQIIVFGN